MCIKNLGLTTEYRATFPTILIEVARWLVSRFQGILFKWLVGSSVDSKVYYSNGSLARRLASRFLGLTSEVSLIVLIMHVSTCNSYKNLS